MLEVFSGVPVDQVLNGNNLETDNKYTIICFWTSSNRRSVLVAGFLQKIYQNIPFGDFEIIGVHTPEFQFEKDSELVKRAMEKNDIEYRNVLDNDYYIWSYFNNQVWPSVYLFDKKGELVHEFFEDTDYSELQKALTELSGLVLKMSLPDAFQSKGRPQTKYFGAVRGEFVNSPETDNGGVYVYELPESTVDPGVYLVGTWKIASEYAEAMRQDCIIIANQTFKSCNIVAGSEAHRIITFDTKGTRGDVTVSTPGNYNILKELENAEKGIKIAVSEGIRVYALTFE